VSREVPAFGAFLEESLELLQTEIPVAYRAMCAALAGRAVTITVGGDAARLVFDDAGVAFRRNEGPADVCVRTTRRTILDLVAARLTLLDAALADRLELVGSPDDVIVFHDGLMAYLHGAVRAPSFPALLGRYARGAEEDRDGEEVAEGA
jgi:hypothetical protein